MQRRNNGFDFWRNRMDFVGVKIILGEEYQNVLRKIIISHLLNVDCYLILLSFVMFHKWMQLGN